MLKPAHPSSPSRPPIEHLYFTFFNPENDQVNFFSQAFAAAYAAHRWLDHILSETPARQRWIDPNHLELEHDDYRLIIKGTHLEDMIEYQPTKEEKQWTPPYPDNVFLDHARTFWIPMSSTSMHTEDPEPEPKPKKVYKTQNRHRSTKPPSDPNSITVAQLAQEADIPSNKARQILRKAEFTKPPNGWTYKIDDPLVAKIRKLFSGSS
jgi:hypothetical protein